MTSLHRWFFFSFSSWLFSIILLLSTHNYGLAASSNITQVPQSQVNALQDFYLSTNGQYWTWRKNTTAFGKIWNFSAPAVNPCDDWQGITCIETAPSTGSIYTIILPKYNLSGTLPSTIGNFSSLENLELNFNNVSGTLPKSLCTLKSLQQIEITANEISKTIPACIFQNLTALRYISLAQNELTGELPDFGNLKYLAYIILIDNHLQGSLPATIRNLVALKRLYLGYNHFTGNLNYLTSLTRLSRLSVNNNQFSGNLTESFGNLKQLTYLYLHKNHFTGSFPNSFQNLKKLRYLSTSENSMSGPLSTSLEGLNHMQTFILGDNYYTSTIPSYIGSWNLSAQFSFYSNYFSGTLPSTFSKLPILQLLLVQENLMSGNPRHSFNTTIQQYLLQVDISENFFTGGLPDTIFGPSLISFTSFQTCFDGRLPSEICNSKSLRILDLDGLTSNCAYRIWPDIPESPDYAKIIHGGVPDCIWKLQNLTQLRLSGNGLTGTIPTLSSYGNLTALDLSFNSFDGTIPSVLQSWVQFDSLNLASNKFVGKISDMGVLRYAYSSKDKDKGITLDLYNNRLSGPIPTQIEYAYNIDILQGNIFSCSARHEPPVHDSDQSNFVCGSNLLDFSLYGLLACGLVVTIFIVLFIITLYRFYYWFDILKGRFFSISCKEIEMLLMNLEKSSGRNELENYWIKFQLFYFKLLLWRNKVHEITQTTNDDKRKHLNHLIQFLISLKTLRRITVGLSIGIIIITTPVFASLKQFFGTYTIQYRWFITGVFLSGEQPAVVIMIIWSISLFFALFFIDKFIPFQLKDEFVTKKSSSPTNNDQNQPQQPPTSSRESSASSLKHSSRDSAISGGSSRKSVVQLTAEGSSKLVKSAAQSVSKMKTWSFWISLAALFGNALIVILMKSGCIYLLVASNTTWNEKVFIEIALSSVDVIWGSIFLPSIISRLPKKTSTGKMKLKSLMLFFNSLISSILIIMIADSSCFSGLFVPQESVQESFTFSSCLLYSDDDITHCLQTTQWSSTRTFQPYWIYNYDCYSTVVTAYVPVFLLTYITLAIFIPLASVILVSRKVKWQLIELFPGVYYVDNSEKEVIENLKHLSSKNVQPFSGNNNQIDAQKNPEGALKDGNAASAAADANNNDVARESTISIRESHVRESTASAINRESVMPTFGISITERPEIELDTKFPFFVRRVLYPEFILASAIHHLIVLLTFGILCPALAVAVGIVTMTTTLTWEILIGRWIFRDQRVLNELDEKFAGPYATKLDEICEKVCCGPRKCFFLLSYGSALFFGLVLLDMAGDQQGWERALWAPVSAIFIATIFYLFFFFKNQQNIENEHEEVRMASFEDDHEDPESQHYAEGYSFTVNPIGEAARGPSMDSIGGSSEHSISNFNHVVYSPSPSFTQPKIELSKRIKAPAASGFD